MHFYIVNGLSKEPVIVQASIDGSYFNLSSYYNLTALYYNPILTVEDLGSISSLIEKNKEESEELLQLIKTLSEKDERIKTNDVIMFFRALFYSTNDSIELEEALKKAIYQDDSLSEFHFKVYKVIQDAKRSN